MEIDDNQEVFLHYLMLEFLYDHRLLIKCSSSHVWEEFKKENRELTETLSSDDLKLIFWRDIIVNIENYELLSQDMKEYFDSQDYKDPNMIFTISHNEPKGGGIDFKLINQDDESSDDDEEGATCVKVVEAFKPSIRGFDSDQEPDVNCIKIVPGMPPTVEEHDGFLEGLIKGFSAILRPDGEGIMSFEQIALDLANPHVLSNLDDIKKLPVGIQQFMNQFEMFKEPSEAEQDQENYNESPSLIVPSSSSLLTSALTDKSNQSTSAPTLRSNSSNPSFKSIPASTPKASKKPRSKKNLVPEPSINARMEGFMSKFSKKRRRTVSPDK